MHYLLYNNPKLSWILASDALIYIPIELLLEKMPRCIHPNRLYSAKVITFPIMRLSQICFKLIFKDFQPYSFVSFKFINQTRCV